MNMTIGELAKASVLTFSDGYRTKQSELGESGFPILRVAQIHQGRIERGDAVEYVRREFRSKMGNKLAVDGDVVLTTKGTVGRRTRIASGDEGYVYSPQVCFFRVVDADVLDPDYLYYWLGSDEFTAQAHGMKSQTDMADYLSLRDLSSIRIRLQSIPTQRAIAHILGALDDKIELNRRMNGTLEAIAQALFKSWFVDFDPVRAKAEGRDPGLPQPLADLFPESFEYSELGEVPTGWRVGAVGEQMVNFDSRRVPIARAERAKRQGRYPYHGAAGVIDCLDDYLFDGIYLLVGEDGSVVQSKGTAVTQYVWGKLWVNNHAHVLQGKSAVSTEQLYLYFQFESVVPYVAGAVQPKLSQGRMNTMPFLFAGNDVCLAFGERVQPLFTKLRANSDINDTLGALRDTLLPKLLSGALRLREAEKVAATVA